MNSRMPVQEPTAGTTVSALPSLAATICICTHNGGHRAVRVLEALAKQTAPTEKWEVMVIDNGSTDDTASVMATMLKQLFPEHGRVVYEPELGTAIGRRRASIEARGEVICFLDDDNIPDPDFVEQALRLFSERPKMGAVGGRLIAEWEKPASALANVVAVDMLGVTALGDEAFLISHPGWGPAGAGLCIRTGLLRRVLADSSFCAEIGGRRGNSLGSGCDMALSVKVYQAGYDRWYDPALRVRHQLSAHRMEVDYLSRLHEAVGRGQAAVRRLWAWQGNTRWMSATVAAKDMLVYLARSIRGPVPVPGLEDKSELRTLHDMRQRLLFGRISEAIRFSIRGPISR
jgi:glycosyltransferase involved in cell wall biosynthesis